jgi:hypothetical protein
MFEVKSIGNNFDFIDFKGVPKLGKIISGKSRKWGKNHQNFWCDITKDLLPPRVFFVPSS